MTENTERWWINRGKPYWPFNHEKVGEKYGAKYVGDFCIQTRHGWSEEPVAVFYQPEPDVSKGHKNYFGLLLRGDTAMICDATSAAEGDFGGILTPKGEIIYSRYRHDFRSDTTGNYSVDGGRDYGRYLFSGGADFKNVRLSIVREHIVVNQTLFLPYEPPST